MCNSLARIPLKDWVWLIQASYDGTLEQHLNYMQTGQDVDLKRLAKDLVHYGIIYKKLQDAYSNTRFCDVTYKWDPPAPAVMPNVPRIQSTQACFAMHIPDTQLSTLETGTDDEAELSDHEYDSGSPPPPNARDVEEAERNHDRLKALIAAQIEDERDDGEGQGAVDSLQRGRQSERRDKRTPHNTWNPKKKK